MSDRGLLRVLVALLGIGFGVAAVVIVALTVGLLPTGGGAVATATNARTVSTTGAPPSQVATPTPPAGVVEVNGLAEMQRQAPALRGKLVRVTVGETELNQLTADYLRQNGPPGVEITNTRVRLRPGQMVLTGNARQGIVATDFTVIGHPVVTNGAAELQIDSVDPALLSRLGGISPGQLIAIPIQSFESRSVDIVEGQMIVTGTVK
jgi:hypothetical protein